METQPHRVSSGLGRGSRTVSTIASSRVFHPLSFILHPFAFLSLLSVLFLPPQAWAQASWNGGSFDSGGGKANGGSVYELQSALGQSGAVGASRWNRGLYEIAWGFHTPRPTAGLAPRIIAATATDVNNNGLIQPGDLLILTLDRSVIVTTPVLKASHFFLPVSGDNLGRTNFRVRVNPYNARQILLVLGGPAVHLTTSGTFTMSRRTANSPSGVDFASSLPLGSVVSLDGVPATDGGAPGVDDSAVDIVLALLGRRGTIGPPGGTIGVRNSPDAAYTDHAITFPAGALSTTATVELRPPVENLGAPGAVQISATNLPITFALPATLRLQYRESDIDWERGQLETNMRVQQLVENPRGVFRYLPVPGSSWLNQAPTLLPFTLTQQLDGAAGEVSANLQGLNPRGSLGTVGVFAGLPIETVDERSVSVKPGTGAVSGEGVVVLTPGSWGAYTAHRIEIPNYVVTASNDPARLDMSIRTATLAERWSSSSGQSFPSQSGAVFCVAVANAAGQPVAFASPVNLTVQFIARTNPAQTDVVYFDARVGVATAMRLVRDRAVGDGVDFGFVNAPTQTVNTVLGTVTVQNVVGLTGTDGRGTFGVVCWEAPRSEAARWRLYR